MYVWLVTVGESLLIDEGSQRLLRVRILADLLVKSGHKVIWWASTFNHARKMQVFSGEIFVTPELSPRLSRGEWQKLCCSI